MSATITQESSAAAAPSGWIGHVVALGEIGRLLLFVFAAPTTAGEIEPAAVTLTKRNTNKKEIEID